MCLGSYFLLLVLLHSLPCMSVPLLPLLLLLRGLDLSQDAGVRGFLFLLLRKSQGVEVGSA